MPLITIAPPAPPVSRPRDDDEDRDGPPLLGFLRFLFWTATLKPLLIGAGLSLACLYWLTNQTLRGRFRHHLRPFWVACLAWYPTPWGPVAWLTAAAVLYLFPTALYLFPMGDRISGREQAGLADAACLLAAWQVIAPGLDLPVQVALFLEFTAAGLSPWWISRFWRRPNGPWWRLSSWRDIPTLPDEWEERWEYDVATAPKAGPLAGTALTRDPVADRYRLRAMPGAGSDAIADADALACSLLSRPRGTVTISLDPDGDANDFLVAFTDREDGSVMRYFDGPTLTTSSTGLTEITPVDAIDGRPLAIPITQPGGAAHLGVLAGSGHGKGILMRTLLLEMCLWDKAWLAVADCKGEDQGGAGVPEFRGWADVYGWSRDQWKAIVLMYHEMFSARAGRYGAAQRPFWHPDASVDGYLDPLAVLGLDELGKLLRAHGTKEIVGKLEDVSSQGRSFGCAVAYDNQRGGRNDIVSPRFRNDVRKSGTTFIGQFGDRNSGSLAVQDFGVDLSKLPTDPGWWYVKGGVTDVAAVKARARMLPSADEVEYLGFSAPHGTVEEWLARTVQAKLHPQDQEIVDKWRPEFIDPAAEPEPTTKPETASEPVRETVEVAAGVHVEAPARILRAVPTQPTPDTTPALDLIPKIVREGGVMTRGEIAEAAGIKPEYASDRLKKLKEMGVMIEAKTADGRPGWRVVA